MSNKVNSDLNELYLAKPPRVEAAISACRADNMDVDTVSHVFNGQYMSGALLDSDKQTVLTFNRVGENGISISVKISSTDLETRFRRHITDNSVTIY